MIEYYSYKVKKIMSKSYKIPHMIVKHYSGSHSYGTSLPTSDVDIRGIFCADPINVRTPFFPVREVEIVEEEDTKYYELAHFMKLCVDCNPNIIETVWVDESDIIETSDAYEYLRENRKEFLSSKIAFTTSGYAIAQLKRIKGHKKWITNPQSKTPPKPKDFVSLVQWFGKSKALSININIWRDDHRLVPYGNELYGVYPAMGHQLYADNGALNTNFDGKRENLDMPIMVVKFNKEVYKEKKEKHNLYWIWKKNRNEIRAEIEHQFGYDAKHAMHLVRLLRMGEEALREGIIRVKRPDAAELLAIRNGSMTYEEIIAYADEKDKLIRETLYKATSLPKRSDLKKCAEILMVVQDMLWKQ